MTNKIIIGVIVSSSILAFAVGRYTARKEAQIIVRIVEVEKKHTQVEENKEIKRHEERVITETPDGTKTTKTVVDTVTDAKKTAETKQESKTISDVKVKESFRIYGIAGYRLRAPREPIYGAGASAKVLGPVEAGVMGLTDGTVGVTVGISF